MDSKTFTKTLKSAEISYSRYNFRISPKDATYNSRILQSIIWSEKSKFKPPEQCIFIDQVVKTTSKSFSFLKKKNFLLGSKKIL